MSFKREWLIEARKMKRLSRAQAAEIFDIDVTYMEKIENGKRRPRFELAFEMGEFFGLDWQRFYVNGK